MKLSLKEINTILCIMEVQIEAYRKTFHDKWLSGYKVHDVEYDIYKTLLKIHKKLGKIEVEVKGKKCEKKPNIRH